MTGELLPLVALIDDRDVFSTRGDDTIALFDWMDQLRAQALSTGGTVLSHLGNHEWMNVIGESNCFSVSVESDPLTSPVLFSCR